MLLLRLGKRRRRRSVRGHTSQHQAAWQRAAVSAPWAARRDLKMATYSGGVVVVAGFSGRRHSDCWWSGDGREWACWLRDQDAPFQRRFQHALYTDGAGGLCVAGGEAPGWRGLNDIWRLGPEQGQWARLEEAAPWRARCDFVALALEDAGAVLVAGGASGQRLLDDVVWCGKAGAAPHRERAPWGARRGLCAVALSGNRVLVFGGRRGDGAACSDVWCWAAGRWQPCGEASWPARSGAAACRRPPSGATGEAVVLTGGLSPEGGALQDTWILDIEPCAASVPDARAWRCECPHAPFPARSRHALAWSPRLPGFILAGGMSDDGRFLSDVWTCMLE